MSADIRSGRISADEIRSNFSELHPALTEAQAVQESARCLFCHDAPCVEACPTDIDIPGFIRKIASGNLQGAAITILDENIMGGTCANVCPVSGIQPFEHGPNSDKHIAIVGAGPAGLSCAHRLAILGHNVTVFEARGEPGGLNEYGLAAYKMLDDRAAREVAFILDIGGIKLETGRRLGVDFELDELRQKYDAVFLGMGHNAVNSLGLENEDLEGVHNAIDFIARIRQEDPSGLPVGRHVVVIGGGNTAIDISVQMKKLGAETVTIVYRRGTEQLSATEYEQEVAQTNGVLIRTHAQPQRILAGEGQLQAVEFAYTEIDKDGRLAATGETFTLPADQLFKAIGQRFEMSSDGIGAGLIETDTSGRIAVNDDCRTNLVDVWAGGDCTPGVDLTVIAVQDGKIAAHNIDEYLTHG
jgi:glutamate synthase (NADPH/NADH) small chain